LARIGLLSDSHGQADRTRRAVRLLIGRGVDRLIHLGDVGGERVIDALLERVDDNGRPDPPVHVTFGNTDDDIRGMSRYAESLGIAVNHPEGRLEIDGKSVVFTHGHLYSVMNEAIDDADFLLHGHTHQTKNESAGRTRVINPGALQRAREYTVAVLETETGSVAFHRVPESDSEPGSPET